MMAAFLTGFSLALMTSVLPLTMGFAIDIKPQRFTGTTPGDANVACLLHPQDGCENGAILVLDLWKEGDKHPVAFVRQPASIDYVIDSPTRYQVKGHLDQHTYTGYLNVSLLEPADTDTGLYTCTMSCFQDSGVGIKEKVSKTLKVEIVDKTLKAMEIKLKDMEKALEDQTRNQSLQIQSLDDRTQALDDQSRNQLLQIQSLDDRTQTLNDRVSSQIDQWANRTLVLQDQTQNRTDKATYTSVFSAYLLDSTTVSRDQVVVFGDVWMQQGNAYNKFTGVYTAPIRGMYVFTLTIALATGTDGIGYIQANNRNIAIVIVRQPSGLFHQSSGSHVVELDVGDEVKVVNRVGGVLWWGGINSLFSGYLVKAYD